MIFQLNPYVGISMNLTFSTRKSTITSMIENFLTMEKNYQEWGIFFNEQYYDSIGLSISYDRNDIPEQFNVHQVSNGKILHQTQNLLDLTYNQVKQFLKSSGDNNLVETDETSRCIYSFKFGFYTYSELSDDPKWKDKEKIAMVGVFRSGLHDDVLKSSKSLVS